MSKRKSRGSHPTNSNSGKPQCYGSREEKVALEARNGLIQFDKVVELIKSFDGDLQLSPQVICDLQHCAIHDLYICAGNFRWGPVYINNTPHDPPTHESVEGHVVDMCDYSNSQLDGIHVCAYLMWRLNWIHPFFGGNGRTSRAVGYLALCKVFNVQFPGTTTIPDLIESDRNPYYAALDQADEAWAKGKLNVSKMEELVRELLTTQLKSAEM